MVSDKNGELEKLLNSTDTCKCRHNMRTGKEMLQYLDSAEKTVQSYAAYENNNRR